ncbi:penicillin-binding protein 1C [Roseovarius aestuariivivens]|uniref:penicillin-binding protein 1C n=1 Tax=Roseovarius aestuariivivens TaxID=1888910 RepID=UPI00108081BC|nr:penicillin-binding protein 1C [Roseovarius aestuariivivens]
MRRFDRFFAGFALLLFLAGITRDGLDLWIARTELPSRVTTLSTEVRDRNGHLLRVYTVEEGRWRLAVTPETVDPLYRQMLLAYEDKRFDHHAGVDPIAMLRALGQALWHGRVVSGGSTLSMQVARLLENSGTGQLEGKLRQIRVALALERQLDKREIFQLYLERAPFGGNLEGIRAASLAYFGKEPRRLTPAEAALLVALPQAPEARRPDRAHPFAEAARDRVLRRSLAAGILSADTLRGAQGEPVPHIRLPFPQLAPHLSDRAVKENPHAWQHDLTLDASLQTRLEAVATRAVRDLPDGVSAALVIADHRSGEILASVGSARYSVERQGFVDMTQAFRSPGSTLKPIVYALAFDRGLAHPQTLIDDRPVRFGRYAPRNFDGAFRGMLPVAEALRLSLNIPVVLLLNEIGPAHLIEALRRSGVESRLPGDRTGLAVALGGIGVSLEGLTQLYAMLASGGLERPLHWRKDSAMETQTRRVLGQVAAWQVGDILAGLTPPAGAPRDRIAYKTGTSYGHRDAWAVGFDGAHVAAVWIGRPDGTPVPGAFGGELAAPVLFEAFQRLKPHVDPLPPPPPDTLILPTARLPQPLREFAGRDAPFGQEPDAPKLIFPPDGAKVPVGQETLVVKLRDGVAPFALLANGKPLITGLRRREAELPGLGYGYSTLSVIDAEGRSAKVRVWIE